MKIDKSRVAHNAPRSCTLIAIVALAGTSPVNAATTNMSASATIVPPVAMAQRSDMRFSRVSSSATPRTLTLPVPPILPQIPPTSAPPIKSGVGTLQISGPASSSFGVSTQTTTSLTSGDNTMTLDGIKLRYGASGTAGVVSGPGILNAAGNGTIVIGGALNVAASQPTGTYAGSLMISVDY